MTAEFTKTTYEKLIGKSKDNSSSLYSHPSINSIPKIMKTDIEELC
jgi:hypothetical protein